MVSRAARRPPVIGARAVGRCELAPLLLVPALLVLSGCERSSRDAFPREVELPPAARPMSDLPEAFSLRFEQVEGTGFSRESWDLEILQVGSDIRLRGGIRTAGSYVPVFRSMDPGEFSEIWQWVHAFPLDGYRVKVDSTAAPTGWRKTLRYDAVLGVDRRELSDNQWTRPSVDAPWLQAIEDRLHLMILELAGKELDSAEQAGPVVADSSGVLQKTLQALGEGAPPSDSSP